MRPATGSTPTFANALRANHSEHLGLATTNWTGTRASDGANITIWQVTKARDAGDAYFRSYIADYEQGTTRFTTLGVNQHAEFCFTVNMNGCTFGLGMQAGDGTRIVSHGNAANTGAHNNIEDPYAASRQSITAIQSSIQYSQAKAQFGPTGQVFEPSHYRQGGRQSVTFGYRPRGTGAWGFYFIGYNRGNGGVYTSYGVLPMPTNACVT